MSEEKENVAAEETEKSAEITEKPELLDMAEKEPEPVLPEKSEKATVDPEKAEGFVKATEKNGEGASLFMNEAFDWLESIVMAIVAIIVIFTFFVRVNTVSGTSMVPTLKDGEKLLVSDMFYTPAHNDIVIIQAKDLVNDNGEPGKPIVKRIIGIPGDIIHIDFAAGVVYRNGEALELSEDETGLLTEDGHYINTPTTLSWDMDGDVEVPEGCYFVLGDNRNGSKDSRDKDVGIIERNYIVGKAFFSIFPFDAFGFLN